MPRITDQRRAANRAAIVDAARRCFARDGFHQTSMPDLVAEAGISAGAFYRYFSGKDEIIREIARDAFVGFAAALGARLEQEAAPSVDEVVTLAVEVLGARELVVDGRPIDLDEQFRCAVQGWGEVLRDPALRAEATAGLGHARALVAGALDRGRAAGRVPAALDPHEGAQLLVTLVPGLILSRVALGAESATVVRAVRALLGA